MARGGRHSAPKDSERRCIATGASGPKFTLVRFVAAPDGRIVPDVLNRLPGRGIWVSANRKAIDKAVGKGLFARAAKTQVSVPADLAETVENALAHRVAELISLARKAGLAIAGYEKVRAALAGGDADVLIQASDGSDRGKSKLRPPSGKGRHITVLSASELGLAFGRENVIHGALRGGGLTTRVVEEAERLAGMRAQHGGERLAEKDTTTT